MNASFLRKQLAAMARTVWLSNDVHRLQTKFQRLLILGQERLFALVGLERQQR
jgi:hypothetical protein